MGRLLAALATGLIGAAAERLVLSRLYGAPELFQLLATFALLLIIGDATLALWGPEDLFSARAPGLAGAVEILGRRYPQYDLLLIAAGPIVLGLLWLLLMRTRWGRLRAASENRSMLAALGVNRPGYSRRPSRWAPSWRPGRRAGRAAHAGHAGAGPEVIASAFVVVVVGGLGSIPGAFLAALLISLAKSLFVFLGQVQIGPWVFNLSKLTLLAEFAVMAVVLVARPWGLMGKPPAPAGHAAGRNARSPRRQAPAAGVRALLALLIAAPLLGQQWPYRHPADRNPDRRAVRRQPAFPDRAGRHDQFRPRRLVRPGRLRRALLLKLGALPMEAALLLGPLAAALGALVFGWFCVRLSGVYRPC